MPWLIVRLNGQSYALPTLEVRELVMNAETTAVPDVPDYVRGVINFRGSTIPVIDLRKRLGMTSASAESDRFCTMMKQRRQDHVNWLNELESSARERREFKLATDPHKCAFGRWYDSYKPDNVWIGALLRRFDRPHQQIHATADQVHRLQERGDWEQNMALIERTRQGVLASMIVLFDDLQRLIRETRQEITVVLRTDRRTFGVSVDEALAVETFQPESLQPVPLTTADRAVAQLGNKGEREPLVLLLATDCLFDDGTGVQAA
jgi:purine-binding chemotaxis protein CheW